MRIFLLTTCVVSTESIFNFERLQESIDENIYRLGDGVVQHFVLFQIAHELEVYLDKLNINNNIKYMYVKKIVPLSEARNLLLAKVIPMIGDDDIVGYPDDDAWYPRGTLNQLLKLFNSKNHLDFFFCKYGSCAKDWPVLEETGDASVRNVVRNASSNTIFLRSSLVKKIGNFNLMLGVGTRNNGGEDIDYALRAFDSARSSIYIPKIIIGHRDKFSGLKEKYYTGNLMALGLNRHRGWKYKHEYIRKIFIGAFLVLTKKLPVRHFFNSLLKSV